MTPHERLRLASALSHVVPGADLRLRTRGDESIIVGHHPAADIDPCAFRRAVIGGLCSSQPDIAAGIVEVVVGGSLLDLGGGVYASGRGEHEQRWLATLLTYEQVADVLGDVGLDDVPADAMRGCLKPDPHLGVSVLAISAEETRHHHALDEIAAQAAAACFVEELRCAAIAQFHSDDLTGDLR